jgi:hypothetical protein
MHLRGQCRHYSGNHREFEKPPAGERWLTDCVKPFNHRWLHN